MVNYDGAVDGGGVSVFKTNQACVFQNFKITGTFVISSSAEFSLSGMVYTNYKNISNVILDLQMQVTAGRLIFFSMMAVDLSGAA